MKLSLFTFLLTLVTCAWAAAISIREELTDLGVPDDVQDDLMEGVKSGDIVPEELDDGRLKFVIYQDGQYQGYVIQTEDGDVKAFDENDAEFSLDDVDELVEKRWIPAAILAFRVAWYIGKLIPKASKIGKALLRVAKCIGWEDMWNCRGDWQGCIQAGTAPHELYTCFRGIECLGRQVIQCKKDFW